LVKILSAMTIENHRNKESFLLTIKPAADSE
jgi:hypothetical protein